MKYDFQTLEERWQAYWAQHKTFRAPNPGDPDFDPKKPKFYVLDMFPYPSGVGLHVGHPLGYIATDIVARYKRMQGFNVLHPMGYDAFGLPAEQFAVEKGVHPRMTTEQNIANMTRQLKRLGLSYDWDRCLATTDPEYYRWTQWIFLQIYNAWFDPIRKKARPIRELIQFLENGQVLVGLENELVWAGPDRGLEALTGPPIGARKWHELSPQEQREFLDNQRLAYIDEVPVNWCPMLGTVLANEEVTNEGRSERGDYPVYKRPMRQWMLRITAYAERLAQDLDLVDWPEPIKLMQRNWIGRSEGAYADFPLAWGTAEAGEEAIRVFTTRPDTLFGATYMVLAPEHPLVEAVTRPEYAQAVRDYQRQAAAKSNVDRVAETGSGDKTGVFTGGYALNPVNNQRIPIWIADYVLMGYGTGAIMAVPAHDQRDFEFAQEMNLPIRAVVLPDEAWLRTHAPKDLTSADADQLRRAYLSDPVAFGQAFTGQGIAVNSANDQANLNGLPTDQAIRQMIQHLEATGRGKGTVQYKLRDWLFSRQRYWGEPFPILHGPDGEIVALDESELPVLLPDMQDFTPQASDDPDAPPVPPLARAPDSWKYVQRNGKQYLRELNTMPQWAGSCWYYLRFIDPHNDQRLVDPRAERYWMVGLLDGQNPGAPAQAGSQPNRSPGVDLYVGGVEHAVLHLLYARFWHKVLYDLGYVSTPEPFARLFNQGYIQAHAYRDRRGVYVPAEEVEERDGKFFWNGEEAFQEFGKMGKSLKNAIAPDDICQEFGCDTLRLYEMYMGPLDQSKIWRTRDISGVHRFLQRFWRNFFHPRTGQFLVSEDSPPQDLLRLLHKTIKRVTDAMESMSFNIAIAALIEFNNALVKYVGWGEGGGWPDEATFKPVPRAVAEPTILCLSPMAPHICEELWHLLGHDKTLAYEPWPQYNPALLAEEEIEIPVQVNGKLRSRIRVPADADDKTVEQAALADPKVASFLAGKTVRKLIVIRGRLINLVVG